MSQGLKDFVTDIEGEVGCESLALRGAIFLLPSPPPSHPKHGQAGWLAGRFLNTAFRLLLRRVGARKRAQGER